MVSKMNLDKYDAITRREIEVFLERKGAESDKLKGQIAKDLRRVGGEDGFLVAGNYRKLEEKYRRWHVSRKKLAILNDMCRQWCKE